VGALVGLVSLGTLAGAVPLPSVAAAVFGLAAVILLGTAVTGVCPLYSVLGMDTCSTDAQ
jgi:hypothetical protein